jgi:hypothetical protein
MVSLVQRSTPAYLPAIEATAGRVCKAGSQDFIRRGRRLPPLFSASRRISKYGRAGALG